MKKTQLPSTDTTKPKRIQSKNINLLVIMIACILLTGMITGSVVCFWQKSEYGKIINDLELKISSLEKQISTKDESDSLPNSEPSTIIDERDCITGEVWELPDNFPVGMSFLNKAMSGERGVFRSDGSIVLDWGLDYAGPNDKRLSSGIGKWLFHDGVLVLSETTNSDGTYSNLRIFNQNEDIFIIPKEYTGMIIGDNIEKIDVFFERNIRPMWDLSKTPKLDEERCEELKSKNRSFDK